jgi:hypothetical protein
MYLQRAEGILSHPAFWSPFIQLGDSKPIYLATKGGWAYWIMGGVLLAFIMGFFFWRKQGSV